MKKKKSPLLAEKPLSNLPKREMTIYTRDLLERSEKARKRLAKYKARME